MITQARHQHSNSIPKELRLEYGLSKPHAGERIASFACLLAGGTLGILFGTVVATAMGFAGDLRSTQMASNPDAASASVYAVAPTQPTVQPAVYHEFSPSAPEVRAAAQAEPPVAISDSELAVVAPHEVAPATQPSQATAAVQPVPQALNKTDGGLPSVSVAIYRIEGDATVVDYDADAGTIEVRDGRTFLLAGVGSQTESAQWQDYVGNVHYSCDQGGNCTLSKGGAIGPSAKLLSS